MAAISHANLEDLSSAINDCVNMSQIRWKFCIYSYIMRNHLSREHGQIGASSRKFDSSSVWQFIFLGFCLPGHRQIYCTHGGIQHLRRSEREDPEELEDRGLRQNNRPSELEAQRQRCRNIRRRG